jgi:hypothetical protein
MFPRNEAVADIPMPISSMQGLIWPAIPHMSGNILLTLLFQLEQSQWWTPERPRRAQFRQAGNLLRHAFQGAPYYKKPSARLITVPMPSLTRIDGSNCRSSSARTSRRPARNYRAAHFPRATARPAESLPPVLPARRQTRRSRLRRQPCSRRRQRVRKSLTRKPELDNQRTVIMTHTGRGGDRNGGLPRLSDGVARASRCGASPRPTLLAENLGKPSHKLSL